jgi:hypothetical protein
VTGLELDLRSPLPDDLRRALASIAHDDTLLTHRDPLDVFGFYEPA